MLPRKILKNLHTVEAILIPYLLNNFYSFCFNYLSLKLSVLPNITHIVHSFLIMHALAVKLNYYWKGSKLWRNCVHQKHVLKWLMGGCIPHTLLDTPRPALITSFLPLLQPASLTSEWCEANSSQLFWSNSMHTLHLHILDTSLKNKGSVSKGGVWPPNPPSEVPYFF